MTQDKKLRNLLGFSVFAVALFTYFKTMAPTVSFWDCGEFLASASILGNPHPPGNPLFMLLGRLFLMVMPMKELAVRMNFLAVLAGALTIWMVFLFTVRVLRIVFRESISSFAKYTGGIIAAFLVTFCDTFWFSAVEAEMYTLSMLVVMITSWLVLEWYEHRGTPHADRTLILIAYISSLGMGVSHFAFITVPVVGLFLIISDKENRTNIPLIFSGLMLLSMLYDIGNFVVYMGAALLVCLGGGLLSKTPVWKHRWSLSAWVCFVALIGFSVYLYVPIRSSTNPDIDEGGVYAGAYNGQTLSNFKDYLERKQYGSESMLKRALHRRAHVQNQLLVYPHIGYGGYMLAQYLPWKTGESRADESEPVVRHIFGKRIEFPTLYLGLRTHPGIEFLLFVLMQLPFLYGGYLLYKRHRELGIYLLVLYGITSYGMIFYMNFADGTQLESADYEYWKSTGFDPNQKPAPVHIEVRDRDYFFTPGFMFMGILFGVSAALLLQAMGEDPRRKRWVRPTGLALAALALAVPAWSNWHEHNRTGNYTPWDYAYNLLMSCRPHSVLFTNGDNDTFPLWFMQEGERIRRDVRVVNLSLVNTDWYIKQLRSHQPALKIGFTDDEIEKLEPQPWSFKGPVEIRIPNSQIHVTLQRRSYIRVQDIMVLNIVQNNYPQWNMEFAVTVGDENEMGLEKYTVMEGMVYTLVEEPKNQAIDVAATTRLVDSVYRYRGLGDPNVYVDLNTQGLLTNYSATNFRLVQWAQQKLEDIQSREVELRKISSPSDSIKSVLAALDSDKEAKLAFAQKYLDLNARLLPSEWRVYYYAGQLYAEMGETQKAETAFRKGIKAAGPEGNVFMMNLAQLYQQTGQEARAESLLIDLHSQDPSDFEPVYTLAEMYEKRGDLLNTRRILSEWLAQNPSHKYASMVAQQVEQLDAQIQAAQRGGLGVPGSTAHDTGKPSKL